MAIHNKVLTLVIIFFSFAAFAQHSDHQSNAGTEKKSSSMSMMMGSQDCDDMMVWDKTSFSCIGLPRAGMPMGMWMVHGNGFLVQSFQEGPRGRNQISLPNMMMIDVGQSYGNNYFDVNLMLTAEKWTFPKAGYPELLQIG